MNQLTIVHKKSTNNSKQVVTSETNQQQELENKREGHGLIISQTRNVFNLLESKNVYYVQSEHSDNIYYFVKYNPDVIEYCSCPDNSIRSLKCKHIWSIEYAIRLGTLKEIDHLPKEATRFTNQKSNSCEDSEYSY